MVAANVSLRDAFKLGYRFARIARRHRPDRSAYWIADWATRVAVDKDFDYQPFLDVEKAVLWAIHWRFYKPVRDDVPAGLSERHLCFEMTETETRTWYSRTLPA